MLSRNIFLFKVYYFFWRFKPLATLMVIYFSQIMESYAMAMAVFSVFNISYALAKIPCGLISDKIGRKPVIIFANVIVSVAFLLLAFSGQLTIKGLLFAFALLWGIGEALLVGTIDALMFETSQNLGCDDKFYTVYSKSMFFDQAGCAFGAFWAMAITLFLPLQFVAWLSVFPPVIQTIISFFFIEPKIKRQGFWVSFNDIKQAISQFKSNKVLLFYTISDIYFSTLGDISHRFESAYFKLFASDWIISLARMLKHFFGMIGFATAVYLKKFSRLKIYFGSILSNVFVRTLALVFNNALTPFVHMFINFFYATASSARADILQKEYLPQYRATAQSVIQFVKGIYMAGLMFLLGIFADFYSIYSAMILLVCLRVFGLFGAFVFHKYLQIEK